MEPLGWEEDALPDAGRPQEIINRVLDGCDIAIFLFWHRLGTDAGLGLTGSEEEFYRTLERRQGSRTPRILLYFNEADPPAAKVDGEQLQLLRRFRRRIDGERKILYGTFRTDTELRKRLEEALLEEVFRHLQPTPGAELAVTNQGGSAEVEDQVFLVERMIYNLKEQVARLEITSNEPKTLAHLKTEIDRLEKLRRRFRGD